MKRIVRNTLALATLTAICVGIFTTQSAMAISNVGLDPTEFGNSARYALENSVDVSNANNITIPVYYMNPNPTERSTSKPPTDMTLRAFEFGARTTTRVSINGSGGVNSTYNFTISKNNFTYRADINAWVAFVNANMTTSTGRVQFRLQILTPTGTSGKLGYSAANGARFGTANRNRCDSGGDTSGCSTWYNYRIPFGTPCSVQNNVTVKAYIYDGDNTTSSSRYSIQYNRKFSVQVRDTTTNTVVNNGMTGGSGEGNKQSAEYQFTVQPYHKYEFIVNNVYTNNLLQFQLPYDSIESIANCDAFKVTDRIYGSWVEYGIFAVGSIRGAGSGSAFSGKKGLPYATFCDYSKLSFVNATTSTPATNCSTSAGGYSTARTIPDIAANFPVTAGQTPVFDDSDANPQGLYTSNDHPGTPPTSDPIIVSAKTINEGQWAIINAPNADVTITGDIRYDNGPFQSIYNIPQFVIIARNIYIASGVQQVDAWLIAQGSTTANTGILDTCRVSTTYSTRLSASDCSNTLQINGPVMAQKLWLRRTAGSGTGDASGDPAEIFNLRPDAYLWAFARASTTGRVQTVYTQELPPRF